MTTVCSFFPKPGVESCQWAALKSIWCFHIDARRDESNTSLVWFSIIYFKLKYFKHMMCRQAWVLSAWGIRVKFSANKWVKTGSNEPTGCRDNRCRQMPSCCLISCSSFLSRVAQHQSSEVKRTVQNKKSIAGFTVRPIYIWTFTLGSIHHNGLKIK